MARRTPWRRAQEQGADAVRQKKGAANRVRGVHADNLEHGKECEDKEGTDQYVPGGRLGRANSTMTRGRGRGAASAPRAKSTAHVGRANHGTEGAARCGTRVEEGIDGKARALISMPCTVERCSAHLSQSPQPLACHRRQLPRRQRAQCGGTGGWGWWG